MAEAIIHDLGYENVANINFIPGQVVVLDTTNSTANRIAVTNPAGALANPFGVVRNDKPKLDAAGAVVPNQGINVAHWGVVTCNSAGAIAVGDRVSVAGTTGTVQTQARAAAGAQPAAIVGIARTATTAGAQGVEVLLAIGAAY